MIPRLEVRVLGRLQALSGGVPVQIQGRRPRSLLAVLALSGGEPVPTESLYERVWGDEQPDDLRASLYTCVRRLRKALGREAISNDAGCYTLNVARDAVDAVRFEGLLSRARVRGEDAAALTREALRLWQGAPFGDEHLSEWLNEQTSRRLRELWLEAVLRRIDLDLAAGQATNLVDELEGLTADYPLREPVWQRYLIALDQSGRHADALATYEQVRVRLADELGIDPSPGLQALHAELLRGGSASAARPSAPMPDTSPRQLPADLPVFTGRTEALLELDDLVTADAPGEHNAVTVGVVHGMGGVGKTSLAVHWAHRVADRFPDGQLFVNLNGYGPGEPVTPLTALDLVLRGLGVEADQIPDSVQARSALLRTSLAGRRMLLILDNARDAEQVRALLPGSGCLVLVTSRSRLAGLGAREGAKLIRLDVMSETDAVRMLHARLDDWAAPSEDLAAMAELCGHLPLTLSITAERANRYPDVPVADVVAELRAERARLDAFADPDDSLADVRAVFSWSYHALDESTARMFRLLGRCPAPDISAQAAAALADVSPAAARRLLDRLLGSSLVASTGQGRYRLHDLVREYAYELSHGTDVQAECAAAFERLCRWSARTATKAALTVRPSYLVADQRNEEAAAELEFSDAADASAWLAREMDFLRAVAQSAVDVEPAATASIVRGLWAQNMWQLQWTEDISLKKLALQAARTLADPMYEAIALTDLGQMYIYTGEYATGEPMIIEALNNYARAGHIVGQTHALNILGFSMHYTGRFLEAMRAHERALELAISLDRPQTQASVRNHLVYDYDALSMHRQAVEQAELALAIYREHASAIEVSVALDTVAYALRGQGDHERALAASREAVRLSQTLDVPAHQAIVTAGLARCLGDTGRIDEARITAQSVIALMDEHQLSDSVDLRRADVVDMLAGWSLQRDRSSAQELSV